MTQPPPDSIKGLREEILEILPPSIYNDLTVTQLLELVQKAVTEGRREGWEFGHRQGVVDGIDSTQGEVNDLQPSDSDSDTESANAPKATLKNQDKE